MTGSFLQEVADHVLRDSRSPRYVIGVPEDRARRPASLRRAVEEDRTRGALIVEYKRASPAYQAPGPEGRTVQEFLSVTDSAVVTGYSCLATHHGFDGSPAFVAELASQTRRPVLFKEFVLGSRQVEVAARTGAAALLLIARLASEHLLEEPLPDLARLAHHRGLEVLLELHDSAELSLVDGVEADVYGVNTRDLGTLRLDRPRAYATMEAAARCGLRPLLGLSGVDGPAQAREMWARGCDGLLVGTAISRSSDPAGLLASLSREGAEGP